MGVLGICAAQGTGSRLRRAGRRLAAGLCLGLVGAAAAADVSGTWNVVEVDPLIADNDFFGRFSYRLEVRQEGDGYVLHAPRTGTTFGPAPLRDGRLVAVAVDPNRGRTRIDVRFAGDGRLQGSIEVGGTLRRLEGEIDPREQLQRRDQGLSTAASQARQAAEAAADAREHAARATAEADALRQQNDGLRQRVAQLETALADAEAARRQAENGLRQRQAAASPAVAQPAARPRLALELIEPPLHGAGGTAARPAASGAPVVIGRVRAPAGLLLLRVNGHDVEADGGGLFTARLAPGTGAVEVVAVDANGARRTLAFAFRDPPPPVAAGNGDLRTLCYAKAIAGDRPDEAALEACRAAVLAAPEQAINHYNLGVALSRLGRHGEAIAAYQEAAGRWAR